MDSRGSRTAPTAETGGIAGQVNSPSAPARRKPLGRLVGVFKTVSTQDINQLRGTPNHSLWQRNYYEHIIRNGDELDKIREYIRTNPLRWDTDPEFT